MTLKLGIKSWVDHETQLLSRFYKDNIKATMQELLIEKQGMESQFMPILSDSGMSRSYLALVTTNISA